MKELWCNTENRISVRFEYEWRDADNEKQWMRTHGNGRWEFDDNGLMRIRDMSANDYTIQESERRSLINKVNIVTLSGDYEFLLPI